MTNTILKKYKSFKEKINALNYAFYIINWDSETIAPIGCMEERAKQVGKLTEMLLELSHDKEYINCLEYIKEHIEEFDEITYKGAVKEFEDLEKEMKVPNDLLIEYQMTLAQASSIWAKAKESSDYSIFKNSLQKIIEFNKQFIEFNNSKDLKGYDILLDMYEKGFTVNKYDEFFNVLKTELVPFVKKILNSNNIDDSFTKRYFDVSKQKEFSKYLMDVLCFDQTYGITVESEHPFTSGYGTTDVRVTNHYYENLITSSIFSMIHELGHATYERGCDSRLDDTPLSGGTTLAMHESQSRLYENIIGRSYSFWVNHYSKLQAVFKEELKDIDLDTFYKAINKVESSLIRTEADELTYSLHIMVRYEIERAIFENKAEIDDLPALWNKLYKEYLGIVVPNDKVGILQDIHWAGGSFGYFPTYALGSAYAAQLYHQMKKELDVDKIISTSNLEEINEWLKEKVHKYGGLLKPEEILLKATGEKFNPMYYVEYLKEKYSKIYNIE